MSEIVLPDGVKATQDGETVVISAAEIEAARARALADRCDELLAMGRTKRRELGVRFSHKQIEVIRDQAREKADANY